MSNRTMQLKRVEELETMLQWCIDEDSEELSQDIQNELNELNYTLEREVELSPALDAEPSKIVDLGTFYALETPISVLVSHRLSDLIEYYSKASVIETFDHSVKIDFMLTVHLDNLVLTYGYNTVMEVLEMHRPEVTSLTRVFS